MGMDLMPVNPTKDAPTYIYEVDGIAITEAESLHYSMSNWVWLLTHLIEWGVKSEGDTSRTQYIKLEVGGPDEGERDCYYAQLIPEKTCIAAADTMEANIMKMHPDDREWLRIQIHHWRTCGGYALM